jgi:acyl-CoA thioesterase I
MPSILSLGRHVVPIVIAAVSMVVGSAWFPSCMRQEPADSPMVYVALGASDAVGVGATRPASEGWVPRVHDGLPDGTQLVNLGISGATLREVLLLQAPVVRGADATLVTIWPGVNDIRSGVPLAAFESRLDALLGQMTEYGVETVVMLNIPDLRAVPAFAWQDPNTLDQTVRSWNDAIQQTAERHGALVVDLYGSSLDLAEHPEYVSIDGFHPSSAGHHRISELVLAELEAHAIITPVLR